MEGSHLLMRGAENSLALRSDRMRRFGFEILPAEPSEFAVAVGLPAETGIWSTLLGLCNQIMLPGVCETTVGPFRLSQDDAESGVGVSAWICSGDVPSLDNFVVDRGVGPEETMSCVGWGLSGG
jgi:hypothetical protein